MNRLNLLFLIPASLFLLSASCRKDNTKPDQLSLLPPATQTGANTFGCLVNGKAFVPKNQSILQAPILECQYIPTFFEAVGGNKSSDGSITDISVQTDSLTITAGETINLKTNAPGNASASYLIFATGQLNNPSYGYRTNNVVSGQLTISKVDLVNRFVSGTFYFNAVNGTSDTVKITDGRFDLRLN